MIEIHGIILLKFNNLYYGIVTCTLSKIDNYIRWACNQKTSPMLLHENKKVPINNPQELRELYLIASKVAEEEGLVFLGYRNIKTDTCEQALGVQFGGYPFYPNHLLKKGEFLKCQSTEGIS